MKKALFVLIVVSWAATLFGCATVHRYPAYRGRVLELGTDKPIEGAGVLAVYWKRSYSVAGSGNVYLGYQAMLTDRSGMFEVPPKTFSVFEAMASFDPKADITIYKTGYGNFPASFPFYADSPGVSTAGHGGKTDPLLKYNHLPPRETVTFWLPKLETKAEIEEHDWFFSGSTTDVLKEKGFPPPGMKKGQFLPPKYTGEGR